MAEQSSIVGGQLECQDSAVVALLGIPVHFPELDIHASGRSALCKRCCAPEPLPYVIWQSPEVVNFLFPKRL